MLNDPKPDKATTNNSPNSNGTNDLAAENERLRQQVEMLQRQLEAAQVRAGHLESVIELTLPVFLETQEKHPFKDLVDELEAMLLAK